MNNTATASYSAVPSMLIVAPSGRTKELMRLLTPARSSTLASVNGSVPLLDAELNAVSSAGLIAFANSSGSRRATNLTIIGNVIIAWNVRAHTTVSMYQPSDLKTSTPCVEVTYSIRNSTPNGASLMIAIVIAIITSNAAPKK